MMRRRRRRRWLDQAEKLGAGEKERGKGRHVEKHVDKGPAVRVSAWLADIALNGQIILYTSWLA